MIGLDTNVLVRYLAQDDRKQAAKALQLIEKECSEDRSGFITAIVLAELVWVLESCYGSGKSEVVAVLQRILRARQLVVQDAETAWKAIRLFETSKADFANCMIECIGDRYECEYTATFDKGAAAAGMRMID